MFASLAHAMAGAPGGGQAAGGGADVLMQFTPLILMFLIFWFLLIRPQQKRAKAHKQMLADLKRGDHVMTGSGLMGRILEIDDEQILLECGDAKLRMSRGAVGGLLDSGKEGKSGKDAKAGKSGKAGKDDKAEKTDKTEKDDKAEKSGEAVLDDKVSQGANT